MAHSQLVTPGTLEELFARAEAVLPVLAANAAEADETRRLPDASLDAVADAGLFKALVPRRFGGYELPIAAYGELMGLLGQACGSTSWVVSLLNSCHWLVGLLPDRAQQEVFGAGPDARVCAGFAPSADSERTPEGVRLTGRWGFASGCLHSQWAFLGARIVDEHGDVVDQIFGLVPMQDLEVEDTWYVAGMRGTGSNALVARDVPVPDHRILSVADAFENRYRTEHTGEALYRSAFIPVMTLALAVPHLGLARGALRYVLDLAAKRGITFTVYERQRDSTAFQLQVAEAATLIDSASMHLTRAAEDVDAAAEEGTKLSYLGRARVRADTAQAVRCTREALDILLSAHGTAGFAEASPLQRLWRDANVAARHPGVAWQVSHEVYGKALLGFPYEENITPLI